MIQNQIILINSLDNRFKISEKSTQNHIMKMIDCLLKLFVVCILDQLEQQ